MNKLPFPICLKLKKTDLNWNKNMKQNPNLTSTSMSGYLLPLLFPKHLVLPPSSSWHQKPFFGSNLHQSNEGTKLRNWATKTGTCFTISLIKREHSRQMVHGGPPGRLRRTNHFQCPVGDVADRCCCLWDYVVQHERTERNRDKRNGWTEGREACTWGGGGGRELTSILVILVE